MRANKTLSLDIRLSWQVLVGLLIFVGVGVGLVSTIRAQAAVPPSTNDPAAAANVQAPQAPGADQVAQPQECGDLLATTNGECIAADEVGAALPGSPTGGIATAGGAGRLVYLTDANYYPDQALTACAAGYHMASLWEILDVSNIVYAYNHPAAHTKADSGNGPPSFWNGWVRTGNASSNSDVTGTGNCLAWTSRSASDYGVSVRLSRTWVTAPGDIFTWDATTFACSFTGPVWCAKD